MISMICSVLMLVLIGFAGYKVYKGNREVAS